MRKLTLLALLPALACTPKAPPETAPPAEPPAPSIPQPQVGPLPAYTPPTVKEGKLANGARLWVIEDHLLPLVSVRLTLPGGAMMDAPDKWGRSSLTAAMMEESAGGTSTIDRAAALGLIAADLGISSDRESLYAGLDVGASRLDQGLKLMADAVIRPDFREEDWDRVQRLHVNALTAQRDDAPVVASEVARAAFWGAEDPRGGPQDGTPQSAGSLTLEEIRAFHQRAVRPGSATFVVVGDVTLEEATAELDDAFKGWEGAGVSLPTLTERQPPEGTRMLFVDMPGSAQTAIRVQGPGFAASSSTLPAATLAGIVIGGSFTSRLNNLLREQKGYTYGAGAGFGSGRSFGQFSAATSVRTDATTPALADLLGVLRAASGPYSEAEVGKAKAQLLGKAISPMESRAGVASTYAELAALGLSPDTLGQRIQRGLSAGEGDMRKAAGTYIDLDKAVVVLVGDKAAVMDELNAAGYTFTDTTVAP